MSETYKDPEGSWDLIIEPPSKWFDFRFHELVEYKDLLLLLIRRDFVAAYKQTILGPLWYFIQPIMKTMVYMFVFGNIANLGTDGIPQPLFYFSGTILWSYFSQTLRNSANTFNTSAPLFRKIYFPRMVVPISYVAKGLITVLIQSILLLTFYFYYKMTGSVFETSAWVLVLPILLFQLGALGIGLGVIVSSWTTKYRDLKQLLSFGMQLWMYCTPIVYPLSNIPEKWMWVYYVNPVAPIIEMFRYSLLGSGHLPLKSWLISLPVSIVVLLLGIAIFNRNERTFIDVI